MDVPALMYGRRFQAPPVIGQLLSPTYAAELSEDGEIFNSDDDDNLPSVRQILAFLRRVIKVINLTYNDNSDNKGDNNSYTEVSGLRYTRTTRHRVTLTPPFLINRFSVAD
jgi:hypothetical protein